MSWRDTAMDLFARQALSRNNPLATADQRELEALAIRLFNTPEVAAARARAGLLWLSRLTQRPSAEAMSSFEAAVAEFTFHCCLNAANSDAGRPRVLKVEGEPHCWFGLDVPGARRGGNNADTAYRIVPLDGEAGFEVYGQCAEHAPADVTFTLIANTAMSKTIATLEWRDVVMDAGLFRLTIGPEPREGQRNHLQSRSDLRYLFVRDCLTDWGRQRANRLAAVRLDAASPAPAFDTLVARAAQYADDDAAYYWDMCMGQTYSFPVNTVPPVRNAGPFGGLVSQSGSTGHYRLGDDEALVVTVTIGSAPYMSLMAHDPWWRTLDFARRTASLNLDQLARDDDGSVTFVLSPSDPGVHNWIDTGGVHEGIFYFRWQGLPPQDPEPPVVKAYQTVKLADLGAVLPPSTRPDHRGGSGRATGRQGGGGRRLVARPLRQAQRAGAICSPGGTRSTAYRSCDLARRRLRADSTLPRMFGASSGAEMKAILIDGYGGPEVLRVGETPAPRPEAGETLIRVSAIGVNPADPKWRSGMFASFAPLNFPHIPGYDVAGVVEAGGPAGARVAAMLDSFTQGAYAEYAVMKTADLAELPGDLGFEAAAAIPTPGLTGVQVIEEHLNVQPGWTVLITGAVGAVGRFALHAAKTRGARVVAAVRSAQREAALRLGADTAIALGEEDWQGEAFDGVADTVGGEAVARLCRGLRPGGRIFTAATTPIPPDGLPAKPTFFAVHADGPRLAKLIEAVARGEIEHPVARTLPLAEAAEAQRLVAAGGVGGKVILRP